MLDPTTTFELRSLARGFGESECQRRPPALIRELSIVEELNPSAVVAFVQQLRVDVLLSLPQSPESVHGRIV
jgi:hypothetical protein